MKYLKNTVLRSSAFLLIFLSLSFFSEAQEYIDSNDPNEVKSLLNKDNSVTGFGSIKIMSGIVNGERSLITGASGGVIVNSHYLLGIGGYGLTTVNTFTGTSPGNPLEKDLNLYGGYGGLLLGGVIAPRSVVHITVPIVLGAGVFYVSDENYFNNGITTDFTIDQSAFFVIEPGLEIEANITSSFRLALGGTYRLVQGTDLDQPISDQDLSDLTIAFSLRFGRF